MSTVEDLKQRARAGDLGALQQLREQGFFQQRGPSTSYPVSHAQQRIWIADQVAGGAGAYNIPITLELTGSLDAASLRSALQTLIRRHEALRTTFVATEGVPRQFIQQDMALPWSENDLTDDPQALQQAHRLAADHARAPFDLARGPLLRAGLIRLAPRRHLFLFSIHHIVADLISLGILTGEMSAAYTACLAARDPALPILPVTYKDFAARQNHWLATSAETDHEYWLKQLASPLEPLMLPTDGSRPPLKTYAANVCRIHLDAAQKDSLRQLGLRHGMSLFMVLVAIVKILLHRYTGQQDIVLGFPLAGRDDHDVEALIGCFVNTVALRDWIDADATVAMVLEQVRRTTLDAYEHRRYPFDRLVDELDLRREMSRSPVFDVSISLANTDPVPLRFGDVRVTPFDDGFAMAKVDLSFDFYESEDALELAIAYATDLFTPARMQRIAGHFVTLTEHAASDPRQMIGRLPMLTAAEAATVVRRFNETDRPLPADTIIELVERQAARTPAAMAVRTAQGGVSFAALLSRANQLARRLRRCGVMPAMRVGVCLGQSEAVPIAFLGILQAGGVYLPLDPANPPLRLAGMIEDATPAVLLVERALADRVPENFDHPVLLLDDAVSEPSDAEPDGIAMTLGADDPAYVIFTSGSTGRAKAAVLPHRGLVNVACEQMRLFAPAPNERVLQFAALGFDASIFEMVMALASGATLCLPGRDALQPGTPLLTTLIRESINIATLPPSILATLVDADLPALRVLTVAGEACSAELVRRWAPGRAFFNLYGPTETTIWASAARCEVGQGPPTLGHPISNTRLYVLDRHLQPVPIGNPGELCIAGVGVALEYLNMPELTAERLVRDPFDATPEARLYRTGDLARWREDGCLEFLGRIDHQVKLRGYRIEAGEIEAVLTEHWQVADAAVVVREAGPGEQRLIGYVTPRDPAAPPVGPELRSFLLQRLPEYMVPARIVTLAAMPLTPNKKIDRAALPEADTARPELANEFTALQGDLELALAFWFSELLRVEQIGSTDNFFELGGNSLMATRLVSRLRDAFRVDVTIPQLFAAATVRDLVQLLHTLLPPSQADRIATALRRLQAMSPAEKQALLRQRSVP
jgi:amino acid adenylation domain-containing protein